MIISRKNSDFDSVRISHVSFCPRYLIYSRAWRPGRLSRNLDTWYCGFCRKGRLPVFWSRNSIGFSSDPDDRNTLRARFGSPDLNTHARARETAVNSTRALVLYAVRSALQAYPTAWPSASGRGPWTVPRPPASPCRRARAGPRPDAPCGTLLWPVATGCRRPRLWARTACRKTVRASTWKTSWRRRRRWST